MKFQDALICTGQSLELAAELVRTRVCRQVQLAYPETTFLQADAVRWADGKAIIVLGAGLSGKTSLARALVAKGGHMWSESLAPISRDGTLLPFPCSEVPEEGLAVSTILNAPYVPGADWAPTTLSPGNAVLRFLEVLGDAQGVSPVIFSRLIRLAEQASLRLLGERGDCDSVVGHIEEHLRGCRDHVP